MKNSCIFFNLLIIAIFLSGCSSDLVAQRYRPDFQTTLANGNKKVLILEPLATAYKIDDASKEDHETSNHLRKVVKDAGMIAVEKNGYKPSIVLGNDKTARAIMLQNEILKKIDIYIQEIHINPGLISKDEAMKLDYNFGDTAVELGKILDTDLILGLQYKSEFVFDSSPGALNGLLFQAIDKIAKSGITKQELYSCFIVLIDSKTGKAIYSNGIYNKRTGFFSVSEKDRFEPGYIDQIVTLLDIALPES